MSSSSKTSAVTLDPTIAAASKQNIGLSNDVAAMPYLANFAPQVAAMSPAQMASYAGTQGMARAFGMPSTGTDPQSMGLPNAVTNPDGTSGYSTQGLYNQALNGLSPAMLAMLASFHYNQQTGAAPTNANIQIGAPGAAAPAPVPFAAMTAGMSNDQLLARQQWVNSHPGGQVYTGGGQ